VLARQHQAGNEDTMTLTTIFAVSMVLLGFILGCLLTNFKAAPQHGRELAAAYTGGKRAQRAVDIAKLRQLRRELEDNADDDVETDYHGGGLLVADVLLLFDVCQALCLSEGETQHILGAAYLMVIETPVMAEDQWEDFN
jgi:hypothetical protein